MEMRSVIAAAVLVVGLGAVGFLMWDAQPVKLVLLPEVIHEDVAVDTSAPKPNLLGLRTVASAHTEGENARIERNRIANSWLAALADLKAGRTTQGAVERLEMELWVQRLHTGEVKATEVHAALAKLMGREVERRRKLFTSGFASEDDVKHAEVLLARERHAAGDPDSNYPALRAAYLASRRNHIEVLAREGLMVKDVALVEIATLEEELPEPGDILPATAKH